MLPTVLRGWLDGHIHRRLVLFVSDSSFASLTYLVPFSNNFHKYVLIHRDVINYG